MENTLVSAFQSVEEFYRRIYWRAPTATTVNTENYTLSYSGVSWLHSVNHLWLHFAQGIDDQPIGHYLNIAERFFRQYGADYNVVFSEHGSDSELSNRLMERGYFERLRSPIMALDGLPHVGAINHQARIVRVTEGESYDLLQVLHEAFYLGPELSRCIIRPDQLADPNTRHYVAYVNETPVCCASVLIDADGVAGVWNVGTVRYFRRRGLASTVLAFALTEAAVDGCSTSVLLASPMGRSLYEELGYRCIGETAYYSRSEGIMF